MATAGNITAVLTLNAVQFDKGLSSALSAVENFKKTANGVSDSVGLLQKGLAEASTAVSKFNADSVKLSQFKSYAEGVNKFANALKTLSSSEIDVDKSTKLLSQAFEKFRNSLNGSEIKLKGLVTSLNQVGNAENQEVSRQQRIQQSLANMRNSASSTSSALMRLARAWSSGEAEILRTIQVTTQYEMGTTNVKRSTESLTASIQRNSDVMRANAEVKLRAMGYSGQIASANQREGLSAQMSATYQRQLAGAYNQSSSSASRNSSAVNQSASSMNRASSSAKGLGRALSSLRSIGTLVGSMLVYNFAHNLITATRETVNAKSEMEGYFKMLHFSSGQVDSFNNALDRTVAQFQRVNKYSLGETISSIGVEFNLSTQEMEKAMKVTSMITSEYLRAGRNANEASLAVKDVLQGQFQRLSRETGVKGEQLKEAGWSGDTTDVMGLMEALEKVANDRNWDVFAEKANSLNDIVTILQNRFGEWSADLVYTVQPSIVNAFNQIMTVATALGGVLSSAWEWLNSDGIAQSVIQWVGLGTAITGVTTALVAYRTGANLTQMVQMGLRGSIMATIFGLKAEEVATYGSRNALIARITSLKAEQVAEMGVRNAILTKILGLNAEKVATFGLKDAITQEILARKLEQAEMEGATVKRKMMITGELQEQMAKRGTLSAIIAKVAGVNMETFAQKGLIVALAERIASSPLYVGSLKAEEVAEMSTARAGLFLTATLLPLVAILAGLAVAIYAVVKPLQDASAEMQKFGNLVQNGDDIIKNHKSSVDSLTKSEASLKEELSKSSKGSAEYLRTQDKLTAVQKDLATANENYQNSIKAVEKARSSQAKFEEEKTNIAIHNQTRLKDAYIKAGLSATEASEMVSHELSEAEKGANQLREALSAMAYHADKSAEGNERMIERLNAHNVDPEKIKEFGRAYADASFQIQEGMEKFMTSDDWMERVSGWFEMQQGRFGEWSTRLSASFLSQDWDEVGKILQDGFNTALSYLSPWKMIYDKLKPALDEKGLVGVIMDALFGEGDSDGAWDIFTKWADECIVQPFVDWINWFIKDPVKHFGEMTDDWSLALGKLLFGKDSKSMKDIVGDWFDENVTKPIQDWFNGLFQDPASYFVNGQLMTADFFGKLLFGEDFDAYKIFDNFKQGMQMAWDNFISFKWLFGDGNGEDGGNGNGLQKMDVGKILGWLFGSIDLNGISEWFNNNLVKPITDWFNNFISDPLGSLGIDTGGFSIGDLFNTLLGYEVDGLTMMWDWLNNNLIMPLQQAWMQFTADPIGYLGGLVFDFANFINTLFNTGSDGFSMWQWATDNIITPLSNAITTGIANIPIVGDIAQMLGLIPQQDPNAQDKGTQLARAFGNAITNMIGQIPIVGDILRMLGLIPQTNPTANQNGHGVGDNIKQGVKNGINGLADLVRDEFNRVVQAITQKASEAFQSAYNVGSQIVEGIKSAMDMHSPSILSRELLPQEFGVNIPNAITSNADMAYSSAQYYGQQMVDGVSSVSTTGVGLGSMVGEYESDAQTIATSSQLMGTETTLAFNNMQMAVNSTTNSMVGNVNSSYTSMQQKQTTSLNSMKQNNLQAYNDMYLKSNQSLLQMRSSTENVTNQMVHAWSHMKNQIVATANRLKAESTSHFNQLSNTIGSFYRKIQNPSSWGSAGGGSRMNVRGARHPSAGKNFTNSIKTRTSNGHYAGTDVGSYPTLSKNKTMTIRQLKSMICPNGNCDLFDGYDLSQTVNVSDFLSKISGEHGFGSWSSWDRTHYNYIKQKSDQWSMKSPVINLKGGIPTNSTFKVGDFENGTPKISFSEFESMARALFTPSSGGLPYKLYFDSSWKGSWLGAFQAGACNCWDGANGLIAFANTCGFGGHIAHGSWNGIPHVWAVINGRKMDTTGMQQRGTWTPSASAGGLPSKRYAGGDTGKTVNVTVDMSNSTIYGVEDLDERIEQGVKKGMQEEFNDSFAVTL